MFLTQMWPNMVFMRNCHHVTQVCRKFFITMKKNQLFDFYAKLASFPFSRDINTFSLQAMCGKS